jgi:hypothetical protein
VTRRHGREQKGTTDGGWNTDGPRREIQRASARHQPAGDVTPLVWLPRMDLARAQSMSDLGVFPAYSWLLALATLVNRPGRWSSRSGASFHPEPRLLGAEAVLALGLRHRLAPHLTLRRRLADRIGCAAILITLSLFLGARFWACAAPALPQVLAGMVVLSACPSNAPGDPGLVSDLSPPSSVGRPLPSTGWPSIWMSVGRRWGTPRRPLLQMLFWVDGQRPIAAAVVLLLFPLRCIRSRRTPGPRVTGRRSPTAACATSSSPAPVLLVFLQHRGCCRVDGRGSGHLHGNFGLLFHLEHLLIVFLEVGSTATDHTLEPGTRALGRLGAVHRGFGALVFLPATGASWPRWSSGPRGDDPLPLHRGRTSRSSPSLAEGWSTWASTR